MGKVQITKKKSIIPANNIQGRFFDYILIAVTVLLLIVTPFYRGLYFRENFIPASAFIAVAFIILLVKIIGEKTSFIESYTDIAILGFVLAYFISFIFGISKSNSLDGFIKYLAAVMLYKITYELTKDSKIKGYLLDGVVLTGFVTALFSLLGSCGIVNINGVFGWGDRLNGLYQYPNSTASILGGIFLLNIFLIMNKKNKFIRIAYFVSASTMMLTFLETRSRGAMLTLLVAWVLAFLLAKAKDKLALIVYSVASGAVSLIFYSKIYSTFIEHKNFAALFIAFIAGSVVLGFVLELLVKLIECVKVKNINKVLIGIFIIFALAGVAAFNLTTPLELKSIQPQRGYEIYQVKPSTAYKLEFEAESLNSSKTKLNVIVNSVDRAKARTSLFNNSFEVTGENTNSVEFTTNDSTFFITADFVNTSPETGLRVNECTLKDGKSGATIEKLKLNYRFIPNDIAKKINEISLKTESSSERLVFIKDGLKMFKDYFLTGTGAKGWGQLYTKYQTYGYVSREAHNYYLQTAIESGLLGVISLISLLILLTIAAVKLYIQKQENTYMLIGVISMLFELLAHAFLDFDFSLFAMFLILVSCMGWLSSVAAQNGILSIKTNNGRGWLNYFALTLAVILVIVCITMYTGIQDGKIGASLVKTDILKSKKYYESAISKGFYNSAYLVDYSQILTMEAQKSKNKSIVDRIHKNYKEVEANDPYESKYYGTMINFYAMFGYFDDASVLADRLIEVQPFKPESYELKANLNYQIMNYFLSKKEYKEALNYNDFVLSIERQHEEANKKTIAPFELNEKTKEIISAAKTAKASIESNNK